MPSPRRVHGFAGTDDYWTRASSKPWLRDVALPTLVLNARNDPFVPDASLPDAQAGERVGPAAAAARTAATPAFATPPLPGDIRWLARRVDDLLRDGPLNTIRRARLPGRATLRGAAAHRSDARP